jgi:hypothetical protein
MYRLAVSRFDHNLTTMRTAAIPHETKTGWSRARVKNKPVLDTTRNGEKTTETAPWVGVKFRD